MADNQKIKKVIKKSGISESWDTNKIKKAVTKAAERSNTKISKNTFEELYELIYSKIEDDTSVKELHNTVELSLREIGLNLVADSYASYRNYKQLS